jgi:hypothetical protein
MTQFAPQHHTNSTQVKDVTNLKQRIVTTVVASIMTLLLIISSTQAIAEDGHCQARDHEYQYHSYQYDMEQERQADNEASFWTGLVALGVAYMLADAVFGGGDEDDSNISSEGFTYPESNNSGSTPESDSGADYSGEYGCAWGSRDYGTCH